MALRIEIRVTKIGIGWYLQGASLSYHYLKYATEARKSQRQSFPEVSGCMPFEMIQKESRAVLELSSWKFLRITAIAGKTPLT